MKRLAHNDAVLVYHKIDNEGNHEYYFYDDGKKVELLWGITGHTPNHGDRFPHPERNIDLHLDDILWAEDDPNCC